jgi:hypothetical protein
MCEIVVKDGTMTAVSCPTAVVNAPIDIVWALLTEPADWAGFFDIRISNIAPPGAASVGQTIHAESGPQFLHLGVTLEFTEIDVARRTIGLTVQLPLRITVLENLSCSVVSDTQCRVNYHCAFGLQRGWRGAIARIILRREIEIGPADSLSRLKRAAELEFSRSQKDKIVGAPNGTTQERE